jgi:hypothetical protein
VISEGGRENFFSIVIRVRLRRHVRNSCGIIYAILAATSMAKKIGQFLERKGACIHSCVMETFPPVQQWRVAQGFGWGLVVGGWWLVQWMGKSADADAILPGPQLIRVLVWGSEGV